MGTLDGRVAVITGAGRGLGREHALLFAAQGAKVVVNDLGGDTAGGGADKTPAQEVVEEIRAGGGEATVNGDDVATTTGASNLITQAVDEFGGLDILVNNAGILRDRVVFNMEEDEWDAVINVHLKGHWAPTKFAAQYWRQQQKDGKDINAAIVSTSSGAGLLGNPGQTNYGAAKAGIASFTMIVARELQRYGVRANAIAPVARTRLTLQTPGMDQMVKAPDDPDAFDVWSPGNISPLVAYLSTADCPYTGTVFHVFGGQVAIYTGWQLGEISDNKARWNVADLVKTLDGMHPGGDRFPSDGTNMADMNKIMIQALSG